MGWSIVEMRIPTSPTVLAHIAGIVDGEGCVGIYRHRYRASGEDRMSHHVRLNIANTCVPLMDYLSVHLGGEVRVYARGTHKPVYVWQAYGENAGMVLQAILPYLVVKKQHAEIALEFLGLGHYDRNGVPDGVSAARESLAVRMSVLNERKG